MLLKKLKGYLKNKYNDLKLKKYFSLSYSQEGEDMVLRRFVKSKKGFYVDIGAHHPKKFSNTHYFYKRGWRGINIDADPALIEEFNKKRKRDINIASGVGSKKGSLTFFLFNEKALNTFDKKLARERDKLEPYFIESTINIKVKTLEEILKKSLPKKQKIDFMNIDVEGRDLDVLKSNNWGLYRPQYIMVESYNSSNLLDIGNDKTVKYLKTKNYKPVAKTYFNIIFEDLDGR